MCEWQMTVDCVTFESMNETESAVMAVKLLHAALSLIGFGLGVAILYFFRPGLTVRVSIVAASALTLVTAILMGGDLFTAHLEEDKFTFLRRAGWFALGLLFGAGRGDRIVSLIRPKTAASPDKTDAGKAQPEKANPEQNSQEKSSSD